jgi:hypothetical protein
MKQRFMFGSFAILILVIGFSLASSQIQSVAAFTALFQQNEELVRGAQLYDNWLVVTQSDAPSGNHPIWSRQTDNTRSGEDTWLCVSCHGWDYQGKDGAYRSGTNYTGFPGVFQPISKSEIEFRAILQGQDDQEHNFSTYLSNGDLDALIVFLQDGVIDDNVFIDPVSLKVLNGDLDNGKRLYDTGCASCHGADGQMISFRYEGQTIVLGTLAEQDPWRFLHRTRFGTARAPEMTIGFNLGWSAQDGRDVLLYSQTFPTGRTQPGGPSMPEGPAGETTQPGGPARNIITGILTALAAMATGLGFALVLGGLLIGTLLLVVWLMRGRK